MSSADKNYPEELRRITSSAKKDLTVAFIEHVTILASIAAENGSVSVKCVAPSRSAAREAKTYFERRGFLTRLEGGIYLTVSWPEPKPEPWWRRLVDYVKSSRNCS